MEQICDFSPLKDELLEKLRTLNTATESLMQALDQEQGCLLNDLNQMSNMFLESKSLASTFYMKCYLSAYTDKYEELSISVGNLSQRRHGALIVVQRKEPVVSLITPGVVVNAILTHSLIETIFIPGSPLHDGAVLIQRDHIVSAANVLPLSRRLGDRKKMGTRHRAGLGLSEQCDALVIIVSEETGQASFTLNGNLYPFSAEV